MITQAFNKICRLGSPHSPHHFCLCSVRMPVHDVITQGTVEQRGILRHYTDTGAQGFLRDFGDILPVNQNTAPSTS